MPMRRRSLLAALGAGATAIAGCIGVTGNDATTVRPADEVKPMRTDCSPPENPPQETALFSVEADSSPPSSLPPGRFTIGIVAPMTADHPPRLRGWFTSTASQPTEYTLPYYAPLVADVGHAQDGDEKLVIAYPGRERKNECWERGHPGNPDALRTVTLAPGDAICNEMSLYSHDENAACFPPGEYHFGPWDITVTVHDTDT